MEFNIFTRPRYSRWAGIATRVGLSVFGSVCPWVRLAKIV